MADASNDFSAYFKVSDVGAFLSSAAGKDPKKVLKKLLGNENYKYHLIEKGFLSPDAAKIINGTGLTRLIEESIREARRQTSFGVTDLAVKILLKKLGYCFECPIEIPRQAYDQSFTQLERRSQNRINYMRMGNQEFDHGLMLGGLGTGGVERTPQGVMARVGMTYVGQNVEDTENNFGSQFHIFLKSLSGKIYSSVLCTMRPQDSRLSAWKWGYNGNNGTYHALYPIEYSIYDDPKMPAKVALTSFSPVIADNYKESSYPVVVYKFSVTNTSLQPVDVSLMFTMQNLAGWLPNTYANSWDPSASRAVKHNGINAIFDASFSRDFISTWLVESSGNTNVHYSDGDMEAVILKGSGNDPIDANGEIAIAAPRIPGAEISYVPAFDAMGSGGEVSSFYTSGELAGPGGTYPDGTHLGGAIAVKVAKILPGQTVEIPFVLAYDFPRSKQGGTILEKRYTKFFGTSGSNSLDIASAALKKYEEWQEAVISWQRNKILDKPYLPDWYEGAALNMLNLLQTDSVGWFNHDSNVLGGYEHAPAPFGLHLMGESNKVDYCHVETWDVRNYTWERAMLFPELEKAVLNYYAETIPQEDRTMVYFKEQDGLSAKELVLKWGQEILSVVYNQRKKLFSTPHDIWAYNTGPQMNTYLHQQANIWPGLPPRGMLQSIRSYNMTGDLDALAFQYKGFSQALDYAERELDTDGDHIPDHNIPYNTAGIAVWTYDNWMWDKTKGINAYDAGLWLSALGSAVKAANLLGKADDAARYQRWLDVGRAAFDSKLWKDTGNGTGYYKLGENVDDVFSDYLYFLFDKYNGTGVFDDDKVRQTLLTVYDSNVRNFANGYYGAINGTRNGRVIEGEQEREMWTGSSFALGATMLAYGLNNEGWNTIYGTENYVTNQANAFGDWAEAYTIEPGKDGTTPMYGMRAKNYLRALAILDALAVAERK